MVRRKAPEEDIWHNVKDAKKRKQIQDRLAQRARRQRLRQAKNQLHETTSDLHRRISLESDSSLDTRLENMTTPPISSTSTSSSQLEPPLGIGDPLLLEWPESPHTESLLPDLNINSDANTYKDITSLTITNALIPSPLSQPNSPYTVFSALWINGEIQGIPCSTSYSARTPHPTPSIPLPLHPTDTQRLIVHPRWIDRFPFPRMRDTLIKLQGALNEEELIKDIFTMPSWTIAPGRASWDPRAWTMETEWARKWGWLMY